MEMYSRVFIKFPVSHTKKIDIILQFLRFFTVAICVVTRHYRQC